VSFLIDPASYFAALAEALPAARQRIVIVGWDFHGRTRLQPDRAPGALPDELGPLLGALIARRPSLRVHLLEWNYSLLYALERGLGPWTDLAWAHDPRFELERDDRHPFGASQHQKLVILDDSVAFAGGIDLTLRRWDTSEHAAAQPGRVDPAGRPYGGFHDAQIAVDGEAARALAELAGERWRRATGESLERLSPAPALWPDSLRVDARDCTVAIARTVPPFDGEPGVREVQALWLESIARARRTLYVESQYFTAPCVVRALCARLEEYDGPEVLLVLPAHCSGWIEESTMGRLRIELLRELRSADRFGRLGVFAPLLSGDRPLNVHSKICVVDDDFARVGSANLSGRSMGFDSECDLALEADGRADLRAAITGLRNRLLAEHTGMSQAELERRIARVGGSLLRAIPERRPGMRGLQPIADGLFAGSAEWMRTVPIDPDGEPPIRLGPGRIAAGLAFALAAFGGLAALLRR
jgi:phospholipase D1/2